MLWWLGLGMVGCAHSTSPEPPPVVPEAAVAEPTPEPILDRYPSRLLLDGQETSVHWDDGDTFKRPSTEGSKGQSARLQGYNTLESYGPVHRWGEWTGQELYALAKDAGRVAGEGTWTCTTQPGGGGYGRLLVDCPDLRRAMLEQGMAHVFAMEGTPDPDDIQAQKAAMDQGVGMWAKGAPGGLITSLHSMHERPGQAETYNRVADTVTGSADRQTHSDTYETCQEVCMGDSCMLYVPFEQRYGESRAACLR